MRRPSAALAALAWLLAMAPPAALADGIDVPGPAEEWEVPPGDDVPEEAARLWEHVDGRLQRGLERTVARLGLGEATAAKRFSVALVDITAPDTPRVAAVNGDEMMYAASLPKIAVLLAAFEKISRGMLPFDKATRATLMAMIRRSSNSAASAMMDRVGKPFIAAVLRSPRYRLYDPDRNGGLWVGKNYAQTGLWQRDPLHHLSHGATTMQIARFYYLLDTDQLVSPHYSAQMRAILSETAIPHKFVAGLHSRYPYATMYRKSGTWQQWHADSAIVEHDGRRYIAAALCESPQGEMWLRRLILGLDGLIFESPPPGMIAAAPR